MKKLFLLIFFPFMIIYISLNWLNKKINSIFPPILANFFRIIFVVSIVFCAYRCSFYKEKIPIRLTRLEGTDLLVRIMPDTAVSFIKKNYPTTNKRLMIYVPSMVSTPDPPCSKEMISTFNQLKNNPEYQNGYLITPLITSFTSIEYQEGTEAEKQALKELDERVTGIDEFSALCDLAVCIVDLENRWVFDWDNLDDTKSAARMKEIFDLLKK